MPAFRGASASGLVVVALVAGALVPSVGGGQAMGTPSADSVPGATTGARPRAQIGAAVGTVRADSIVPTAPIFQFTDLLDARLPGVVVESGGGMSGSGAQITIRGPSTIVLSSDPIVYLDGVRVASDARAVNGATTNLLGGNLAPGVSSEGRLEDLSPDEIERIDVVPGPAATSRYGMDAANGVIVVTSKRPRAGAAHWSAYAEGGPLVASGPSASDSYRAWGRSTDSAATPRTCPLVDMTAGSCVVDSVTHFSPLSSSVTSPIVNGGRDRYALQVSGAAGSGRYFLAGQREDETGILAMPAPDAQLLQTEDGHAPLPGERRPNALFRNNLRAVLGADLGERGSVSVFGNSLSGDQRTTNDQQLALDVAFGSGSRGLDDGWRTEGLRPRTAFATEVTDRKERYIYGAAGTWHLARGLTARTTLGADRGGIHDVSFVRAVDDPFSHLGRDLATTDHAATAQYTFDGSVDAAVSRGDWSSQATVGIQYREEKRSEQQVFGTVVPGEPFPAPGPFSIEGLTEDVIQRGVFVEELLGLGNRLFVTGALRADGSRGLLGQGTRGYPRAAIAWAPVPRHADALRLRAAYGESGNISGLATLPIVPGAVTVHGLEPERTREYEAGLDATAWDARVAVSASVYTRSTRDAIIAVPIPPSALPGGGTEFANRATIRNRGVEASVSLSILRTTAITWDASLNAWANENRVMTLGGLSGEFFGLYLRDVAGHPLYDIWEPRLTYHDANHDGIIEPDEVSLSDGVDQGTSLPTRALALHDAIGLLHGRLRVGALLDYRGGNKLIDEMLGDQELFLNTRGANDPRAPLFQQAQAIAAGVIGSGPDATPYIGPVEDGGFVRLRELSVTLVASPSVARALRASSASLSLLARNVWLWTRFTGADPEVNSNAALATSTLAVVPQPRYFVVRVNLGM